MDWSVRENAEQSRFEVVSGDEVAGILAYERSDDLLLLQHTEVEPAYEGEGLGSLLARTALEEARSRGLAVIPNCPFVRAHISRHPEYVDLVPADRRNRFGFNS